MIRRSIVILLSLGLMQSCTRTSNIIRIGVAGPMTGDQSVFGRDERRGAELAVLEWNRNGGVLGKKIDVIVEDDQHDPRQAVAVANRLVSDDVVGVVGHFNSNCSIPASAVYHRADIPMISHGSTNPQLTEQGFDNVFRVCGRDDQQGKIAADFVCSNPRFSRIAIIQDRTTYGQGLADEFKRWLTGTCRVVYYGTIIQGDKDFRAVLTDVKSKAPDLIYYGGVYPEAGLLVKQSRQLGIKAVFMSGDGILGPEFINIAGSAADGTYATFGPDINSVGTARPFIERYRKLYGEPGPYSIYSYVAANILLDAIKGSRTTAPEQVVNYLHTHTFDTALGTIQFDGKGDVIHSPYVIWQVRNGHFVQQ
ncbi:MAG: branched-chain amino acid ABC transporter substrate-binding protein [Deltaproteobacteria bacterium]|nr:branched-chain amino acid ABC transporter substrate-binding protein [Deltaproteobacteria bacterium]MCL5278080.1 branched-chain amino acid ABC transporter substrate-binding protein [Deltaproteobacteria bacterium]